MIVNHRFTLLVAGIAMLLGWLTLTPANADAQRDQNYYQATQKFRIQLFGSSQKVTIPKGTVVMGRVMPIDTATGTRQEASFDLLTLNYQLKTKNGWPKKIHAGGGGETSAMNNVGRYLTPTTRPAYMLQQAGELPVFARTATANYVTGAFITVTTDGTLESFSKTNKSRTRTQYRPTASAKITKFTQKGTKRYYYYQKKLTGVPGKRVAKHGKAQYRLTVTDLKQTKTVAQKHMSTAYYYHAYKFGKQTFYTYAGAAND